MPRTLLAASVHASPIRLLAVADEPGSRWRSDASLLRVRNGVYADRAMWNALAPWDRYLARVHAVAFTHPRAIFSHESAAALLGLPIFGEPRDIHVLDPRRSRSRRFGDVCVHTSADPRVVQTRDGLRMTSPAHTAVDLMRVLPPAFALAVGDAVGSAERGGTTHADELAAIAADQSNRRGSRRLALVIALIDARAESPGESVSRAVIIWSGFEAPELQLEFRSEGHTDRVDFGWRGVRALAESDGYEKYRSDDPSVVVKRVIDEKLREDRVRRQCDAFTRWDWSVAINVDPLARRLIEIGVPRIQPAHGALLATLASNPRSLTPAKNTSPPEKHRNA